MNEASGDSSEPAKLEEDSPRRPVSPVLLGSSAPLAVSGEFALDEEARECVVDADIALRGGTVPVTVPDKNSTPGEFFLHGVGPW